MVILVVQEVILQRTEQKFVQIVKEHKVCLQCSGLPEVLQNVRKKHRIEL